MLALCEDPSVVGTPFYLMSFVPGHVFTKPGLDSLPSPAHRRAVYDAMADTLGALHKIDPERIGLGSFGSGGKSLNPKSGRGSSPGSGPGSGGASWSERQLERWARQYSLSLVGDADPEPVVTALIEWLRANRPVAEPGGRLVHGDFRLDNIVFESPVGPGPAGTGKDDKDKDKYKDKPAPGRGVLAVLDWELSTLGARTATSRTAACPTTCRRRRRRVGRPRRIPRSRVRSRRVAFPPRRSLYTGGASRRVCRTHRRGRNAGGRPERREAGV